MKTKSKLREAVIFWLNKLEETTDKQPNKETHGISRGITADAILQAFSEELDELLKVAKAYNIDHHGYPECKSCSLVEAIDKMKERIM